MTNGERVVGDRQIASWYDNIRKRWTIYRPELKIEVGVMLGGRGEIRDEKGY